MQEFLTLAMPFLAMALAVAAGLVLSWLIRKTVLRLNRRRPELHATSRVARLPLRLALCLIGVRIALALTTDDGGWRSAVDHLLLVALMGTVAWLAKPLSAPAHSPAPARTSSRTATRRSPHGTSSTTSGLGPTTGTSPFLPGGSEQ